ncbi:hypothetical protein C8R48DRAFT_762919 [Suillus tomentosus]|nr:hypothetical protein C8R48DRAFT_762919 [Suillus tomentosus]
MWQFPQSGDKSINGSMPDPSLTITDSLEPLVPYSHIHRIRENFESGSSLEYSDIEQSRYHWQCTLASQCSASELTQPSITFKIAYENNASQHIILSLHDFPSFKSEYLVSGRSRVVCRKPDSEVFITRHKKRRIDNTSFPIRVLRVYSPKFMELVHKQPEQTC